LSFERLARPERLTAKEPQEENQEKCPDRGRVTVMEEQPAGNGPADGEVADPELKPPDEAIKDLEPDEQAAEDVTGGAQKQWLPTNF
jgi:hypothetical protein